MQFSGIYSSPYGYAAPAYAAPAIAHAGYPALSPYARPAYASPYARPAVAAVAPGATLLGKIHPLQTNQQIILLIIFHLNQQVLHTQLLQPSLTCLTATVWV